MANKKATDRQVNLLFSRTEDLRLLEFLQKQAYEARYSIGTFIIVALQKAFEGQVPEEQPIVQMEPSHANGVHYPLTVVPTEVPIETPPQPLPVLTPEMEESIRAKIAARTTRKSSAADKGSPTPPASPR